MKNIPAKTCLHSLLAILVALSALFAHPHSILSQSADRPTVKDSSKQQNSSRTILFLGNSLTAGYGLDASQAFPELIQHKIDSLGWNFEVINAGLSGETSSGGLRRLDWLLRRKIDVLVLELGANDALRGLDLKVTHKNLQTIIDKTRAKYPQAEIVIAGMQAPPNYGQDYTTRFRNIFPELAENNDVALIPFLLEGVAGLPKLNLPDRIHPTAGGHKIIAENVWKVLKPVLERLKR